MTQDYSFLHDERIPVFWQKLEAIKARDKAICISQGVTPQQLFERRQEVLRLSAQRCQVGLCEA